MLRVGEIMVGRPIGGRCRARRGEPAIRATYSRKLRIEVVRGLYDVYADVHGGLLEVREPLLTAPATRTGLFIVTTAFIRSTTTRASWRCG